MSGNSYPSVNYFSGCQDGSVSPVHSQAGEAKSVQVLDISQPIPYEQFLHSDPRHHYIRPIEPVYSVIREDDRVDRKAWEYEAHSVDREVKPVMCSTASSIKIEPDRYDRSDLDSTWVNSLDLQRLHYDPLSSRTDSKLSLNPIPVSRCLQVAERFVHELSEHKTESFVEAPVDNGNHAPLEIGSLALAVPSSVVSGEQGGMAEEVHLSPKPDPEQRSVLEDEEENNVSSAPYSVNLYSTSGIGESSVITNNVLSRSSSIQATTFSQDASHDPSSNAGSNSSLHDPPIARFPCTSCDKVFVDRNKLSMHKRTHRKKQKAHQKSNGGHGSGDNGRSEDNSALQDLKFSPESDADCAFICSTCGRGFRLKMALACHMRYHAEERTYSCTDCSQTFTSRWVRSPQLCDKCRHGPGAKPVPKPCRCERCGKCFKDARLLRDHTRSHTGERPFACQVCGKTFAQSGTLYRHKQVHSDSRPYRCSQCNKSYKLKGHLTVHIKSHTM